MPRGKAGPKILMPKAMKANKHTIARHKGHVAGSHFSRTIITPKTQRQRLQGNIMGLYTFFRFDDEYSHTLYFDKVSLLAEDTHTWVDF
jgi:hypothetical protein